MVYLTNQSTWRTYFSVNLNKMTVLINRNPTGRLICIHALVKCLQNKFPVDSFTINDLKYDANSFQNITDVCELMKTMQSTNELVCPYLNNPLSKAKCYLTQSVQHDTQKSKSASDAMNALDGLGFVTEDKNNRRLTEQGKSFAKTDFSSSKWIELARTAVLRYGPFVGLLYNIFKLGNTNPIEIKKSDINLGFPNPNETIRKDSRLIELSMGSQGDTITRTRSVLFSWAVSTGFAVPSNQDIPKDMDTWQISTRDFVEQKKWTSSKYKFIIPKNLFDGTHYVSRPLDYSWLTKNIRSLRERGQETIRNLSLLYESRVQNRRFAIVYALAKCADAGAKLDFNKFVDGLWQEPDFFVINSTNFNQIMSIESKIAILCGIPFDYKDGIMLPLTRININELSKGVPHDIYEKVNGIVSKSKL